MIHLHSDCTLVVLTCPWMYWNVLVCPWKRSRSSLLTVSSRDRVASISPPPPKNVLFLTSRHCRDCSLDWIHDSLTVCCCLACRNWRNSCLKWQCHLSFEMLFERLNQNWTAMSLLNHTLCWFHSFRMSSTRDVDSSSRLNTHSEGIWHSEGAWEASFTRCSLNLAVVSVTMIHLYLNCTLVVLICPWMFWNVLVRPWKRSGCSLFSGDLRASIPPPRPKNVLFPRQWHFDCSLDWIHD